MGIDRAARLGKQTVSIATKTALSISTLASIIFAISFPTLVNAQTAKVVKVSGKRAIVQFPDDARPKAGQLIDLSGGASSGDMGGGSGSREQIIGGSASLTNLSTGGSSSTTNLEVTGRYGWNAGTMEYGPTAQLTYESSTGSSNRVIGAGGFFDYNLVPNTAGTELVYGVGAEASFASTARTTGSNETTGTQLSFQGGGQMKWFPLGNTVAIRGDLGYLFRSASTGGTSVTTSGFVVLGGFYIYF